MLADKGIDPGTVAFIYQEGIHIFPSRGTLIQNGHFQIAVHQQCQRSGNRRCGHNQQMGILTLGGQFAALGYTEAVLLVSDDQSKIFKLGGVCQQRMGSHCHLNLSGGDSLPDDPFLLHRLRTGKQSHRNSQGFK